MLYSCSAHRHGLDTLFVWYVGCCKRCCAILFWLPPRGGTILKGSQFDNALMTKKTSVTTAQHKGSRPIGQQPAAKSSRRWLWLAGGVALALLVLLAAVSLLNNRATPATATTAGASDSTGSTVAAAIGQPVDRNVMGDPNAPVLIQAYEDFQCPHCQDFTAAMESTIRNDLVAPGIARFEFLNRFVIGPDSVTAAEAAQCAADQQRFWEYHDALFAALRSNPQTAQNTANLKRIAGDIGLDTGAFNQCLDSNKYYEELLRADSDASAKGINSTPSVFINGQRYQDALTPDAFKAAVEAAASSAGS